MSCCFNLASAGTFTSDYLSSVMETSQSTILIEMPVVAEPGYDGFFSFAVRRLDWDSKHFNLVDSAMCMLENDVFNSCKLAASGVSEKIFRLKGFLIGIFNNS